MPDLVELDHPQNETLVALLEALLEDAKAGRLQGVAVALVHPGRHRGTAWSLETIAAADAYLAVEVLRAELLAICLDHMEDA